MESHLAFISEPNTRVELIRLLEQSGGMSQPKTVSAENSEPQRVWVISPEEVSISSKKQAVKLIDVRRAALFERSHLVGALPIPLAKLMIWSGQSARLPPADEAEKLMKALGISKDDWIVLYDDHQGQHASRVAWTLEHFGYWNVSVLDRNFSSLNKLDLASDVEVGERKPPPPKRPTEENMVSREELLSMMEKGEGRLIDCRDTNFFPIGHIAGAISLPWYTLSGHGKNFLSPQETLTKVRSLHLEGNQTVLYCSSALNSAHTYVALRAAGLKGVRLYSATFGDWVSSGEPVERGWAMPRPQSPPSPAP